MSRPRLGLVIALAVVFLFGGFLIADDKKDPPLTGTLPANYGKLGLSEEQKQKIYRIQADYDAKQAALKKQLDDLKGQEKTDLEKILSPEQKQKLKDILSGKLPGDEKKPDEKK